jgi:hypothetical protein
MRGFGGRKSLSCRLRTMYRSRHYLLLTYYRTSEEFLGRIRGIGFRPKLRLSQYNVLRVWQKRRKRLVAMQHTQPSAHSPNTFTHRSPNRLPLKVTHPPSDNGAMSRNVTPSSLSRGTDDPVMRLCRRMSDAHAGRNDRYASSKIEDAACSGNYSLTKRLGIMECCNGDHNALLFDSPEVPAPIVPWITHSRLSSLLGLACFHLYILTPHRST